eukprot:6297664-Pyramimonas_sp.AAC.1
MAHQRRQFAGSPEHGQSEVARVLDAVVQEVSLHLPLLVSLQPAEPHGVLPSGLQRRLEGGAALDDSLRHAGPEILIVVTRTPAPWVSKLLPSGVTPIREHCPVQITLGRAERAPTTRAALCRCLLPRCLQRLETYWVGCLDLPVLGAQLVEVADHADVALGNERPPWPAPAKRGVLRSVHVVALVAITQSKHVLGQLKLRLQ